jgi:putative DNA primase/helicase
MQNNNLERTPEEKQQYKETFGTEPLTKEQKEDIAYKQELSDMSRIKKKFMDTEIVGEGDKLRTVKNTQKNVKEGISEIVEFLLKKYDFKTVSGRRFDEIYLYQDGIYQTDLGQQTIKKEVQNILNEICSLHYVAEITGQVKRQTYAKDFGTPPKNLICLNNGVLDLESGELLKHSPEYEFLSKIPVDYDPEAKCPKIEKFLTNTLYPEDVQVIKEWFGYSLYRDYPIKKAMVLLGEGNTGKSTLLNLLVNFIGDKNVSGVSLQKLSTDKFSTAYLHNKHLNSYDDLSFDDINDNGAFKMATGCGYITGEYKFGDSFQFINHSKLTFAANKIPKVRDFDDDAYFSRWVIIKCDNIVEKNAINLNLTNEISTKEELSGMLNIAIKGLKKILKQGELSYNKTTEQIKMIMQRNNSSLAAFVQDKLYQVEVGSITKDSLFQSYCSYAIRNKLSVLTMSKVGRDLPNLIGTIETKPIINGKQVKSWANIAFKKETPEEQDEILSKTNR